MGTEVDSIGLGSTTISATQILNATRHVADRVAADDRGDLLDLLSLLGLPTTRRQLRIVKARAAIEQARKERT
ncbi:hypothetical protein OG601_46960 [Streptomyces sp. NBC_01239]|uniref:hypothetical protein n=1 Tax=Streptomyces sp. NBC_01239 TaxID=2903792 RepID=UPI002255E348|nr:hypothetical protein [Streptomyces sp. NBC_01239]MCX4809068.1 hypothetical protein [Streptomyces sp. NBC_01239]MCX4818115.1 hypothetical protein [Streptomyces sp. NBC_01239]